MCEELVLDTVGRIYGTVMRPDEWTRILKDVARQNNSSWGTYWNQLRIRHALSWATGRVSQTITVRALVAAMLLAGQPAGRHQATAQPERDSDNELSRSWCWRDLDSCEKAL